MRITILYSEHNGCDYHRLLLPLKYFPFSKGDMVKIVEHKNCLYDEEFFDCDILFYSRDFKWKLEDLKKFKEKYGFKVVVDFDDSFNLYYSHILYDTWQKHNVKQTFIDNCENADFIFVTNEQLYSLYQDINPNIEIIPNALPINVDPFIQRGEESAKTRFVYVGGSTHFEDLNSISGLFKRLRSDGEFKQKGEFILCGYSNETDNRNIWDKMEGTCKVHGSYTRRETLPLDRYIEHYNYADVAIAPLVDNRFNNCKSNLKFVEAGCMKLPFICSEILPYTKDHCLKNDGIKFCNKTSEWYEAFRFFIRNPQAIEDYGNVNFEYVKSNYNLTNINKKRTDIFKYLNQ